MPEMQFDKSNIQHGYGFNGMEREDLLKGLGIMYDFGARVYNADLGIFNSGDPMESKFPSQSTFVFGGNDPINAIDKDGLAQIKVSGNYLTNQRNLTIRKSNELGVMIKHLQNADIFGVIGDYNPSSYNLTTIAGITAHNLSVKDKNFSTRDGGERNAIRHVYWQALITQKFGDGVANDVGLAHEGIGSFDKIDYDENKKFIGSELGADSNADLLNNRIGRNIALENPNSSKKEIMVKILDEFKKNGLYIVTENKNPENLSKKYNVEKQRISEQQYNKAIETLNSLDENGYTKEQNINFEKKVKEEKEYNDDDQYEN